MNSKKTKRVLAFFSVLCGIFFTLSQLSTFKDVFGYGYGYSGKITTVNSYKPTISPDGDFIVFANTEDGGFLYKKYDTDIAKGNNIILEEYEQPSKRISFKFILYINNDFV